MKGGDGEGRIKCGDRKGRMKGGDGRGYLGVVRESRVQSTFTRSDVPIRKVGSILTRGRLRALEISATDG